MPFLSRLESHVARRFCHGWAGYLKGIPFETVLWQALFHVVNHGTQTRSEAAVILTSYGHSPGDLDCTVSLRQLPRP
jgi:uncharacterized damage-inducible protein DinB